MILLDKIKKQREKKRSKRFISFKNHPLMLPRGSVRATIAILLTILLGVCTILGREVPKDIAIVWISFVSYYIGHRSKI